MPHAAPWGSTRRKSFLPDLHGNLTVDKNALKRGGFTSSESYTLAQILKVTMANEEHRTLRPFAGSPMWCIMVNVVYYGEYSMTAKMKRAKRSGNL